MSGSERASASEVRGLVHLARKELLRSIDADRDDPGLERLVGAQRRALALRSRVPYVWGATALAAAALALFAFRSISLRSSEPLLYSVQTAGAAESGAPSPRYEFSDGTVISLRSGANLQVLSANEAAPHVRLTRGEAGVRVVHRPNAQWDFSAGPFDVAVVGTAFDLKWDPDSQSFALDLQQGAVKVTGPVLDGPVLLHAGQRLAIALPSGRVAIDVASPQSSGDAARGAAPPQAAAVEAVASVASVASSASSASTGQVARSVVEGAEPSGQVPDASLGSRAPKPSWRALVGRGRFAEVISQAQAMPLDGCLTLCSSADLRALGDAARYTGRASLAEQAFLELRRRFPGSPDSTVAAFLLAHTYEAQHRLPLASTWYQTYLSEAPSGQFSAEASAGRARVADPQ